MRNHIAQIVLLAEAALMCAGCGTSTSLTRDKAARMIQDYPEFGEIIRVDVCVFLTQGAREGLWKVPPTRAEPLLLTEAGRRYFKTARELSGEAVQVEFVEPLRKEVIEVTGIADVESPNVKEVSFAYHYKDVPDAVKRCAALKDRYEAKAFFRLFDDGWRIESLSE